MKIQHLPFTAAAVLVAGSYLFAAIPLPTAPDWTSNDNGFSTGGAFADLDTNGFIDLCTSNGNDMANDSNAVYFNSGGTLENSASWRSIDVGYFGHAYAGDVNNDGLLDLAVAYLGKFGSGELTARVYRNSGNGLEETPFWKAHDRHSSFDCCLGDFDLDGDLDLAITSGDAYQGETDSARIYRNNDGVFDTLPCWVAHDGVASDAIRFADIDNDGDLDLFVGQTRKVSMYRNQNGVLDAEPSWVTRSGVGWVLRLALGDYNNDGFLDLAAASNSQIGGINNIKVFHNNNGTLDSIAAFTMLSDEDFSSCVAWADVNGDGFADLAAGGWWDPVVVFENNAGTLDTTPGWSWYPGSFARLVCETVMWGDVTNSHLASVSDCHNGNGQRHLFNFAHRPIQFLDSVKVQGTLIPPSDFCYDPLLGWISFASAPPSGTGNVVVFYRYSTHPDLAVTNWESNYGNFLFRNTTPSALAESLLPTRAWGLSACPNPASGPVTIRFAKPGSTVPQELRIYSRDGRLVKTIKAQVSSQSPVWTWDGRDQLGKIVNTGIYLALETRTRTCIKLVRLDGDR